MQNTSWWCLLLQGILYLRHLVTVLPVAAAAAAAAASLQLCPTLCDSIDGSPPGSLVPGILQARTLEWVAIFFSGPSSYHQSNHLGFWLQVLGHLMVFSASLGAFILWSHWALCYIGYYSLSNSVCLFLSSVSSLSSLDFWPIISVTCSNLTCLVLPLSLWWYLFDNLQARVNSFICFLSNLSVGGWVLLGKKKKWQNWTD